MNFRIGEGWDIHAFVAGRKLISVAAAIAALHPDHSDAVLPSMQIKGVLGL